jgi:hypothetical protein
MRLSFKFCHFDFKPTRLKLKSAKVESSVADFKSRCAASKAKVQDLKGRDAGFEERDLEFNFQGKSFPSWWPRSPSP